MPIVNDYSALISGYSWNGIEVVGRQLIVTYSFPTTSPAYNLALLGATAVSTFSAFTANQKTQARAALAEWSAASGVTFVEVSAGKGDINFGIYNFSSIAGQSAEKGLATYPSGGTNSAIYPNLNSDLDAAGDVYINSSFISGGVISYPTLLHMIGHTIGLKHPTVVTAPSSDTTHDEVLAPGFDPNLTIMSQPGDGTSTLAHLSTLDKAAAAAIYGAAGTGGAQFTSWSFDAPSDTFQIRDYTSGAVTRGTSVRDYIVVSGAKQVFGLSGDDTVFGGNGGDYIDGGDGNDFIQGGTGADTLIGGAGNDRLYSGGGLAAILRPGAGSNIVYAHSGDMLDYSDLAAKLRADLKTGVVTHDALSATDYVSGAMNITGTDFGDRIYGTSGANVINDGAGDDIIFGEGGADVIDAGEGANTVIGSGTIHAGAGSDFIQNNTSIASAIFGGGGNDTIYGGTGGDSLWGGDGNDRIYSGGGTGSEIHPGAGSNIVYANASDVLDYSDLTAGVYVELAAGYVKHDNGAATDYIIGVNNVTGTDFDDRVYGNSETNFIVTGLGNDVIYGGGGYDIILAGDGDNKIIAAGAIFSDGGADFIQIVGDLGSTVQSGAGNDTIYGGTGGDEIFGQDGNDRVYSGGGSPSIIHPGAGSNIVYGHTGDVLDYSDLTSGAYIELGARFVTHDNGAATDYIDGVNNAVGTDFDDRIYGTAAGHATLDGRDGNDVIYAIGPNDTLRGGAGDDWLVAGGGATMYGQGGANRFYIVNFAAAGDVIGDFVSGTDKLYLREATDFGSYTAGQNVFVAQGTGASDAIFGAHASQGFAFNASSGELWFDKDGSGGSFSAVLVATLVGVPSLSANDIVIYNG